MMNAAARINQTRERTQNASTKNATLEAQFVRTKRYDRILEEILVVHEQRKARGLALLAPTGSGKTRTLDELSWKSRP